MGDKGIVASTAGPRDPAQRGDRRHDPGLAHARAGRAARARGRDRPAGPPVAGAALVPAAGLGLPGLRPDDLDLLPGDGPADPGLPQGRRCRSGARRTRAPRSCASRSWAASSTARANRSTPTSGSSLPGTFEEPVAPGVHRRPPRSHVARRRPRRRVHRHPRGLRGAALSRTGAGPELSTTHAGATRRRHPAAG